ncbi:MAG: transcriptional repressor [Bryobacterales bacterium]|jgi:Fur family ferric uptake transcriptional regulator|nr:transcriptional repressor [Bryobacterales bacterium]
MPAAVRSTRQRRAIREVFEEAKRPLSPEEVCRMAKDKVEGLGIATVYRTIRTLMDESWLVPVELPGEAARYEISGKDHHHHFHCRRCGKVFEIYGCLGGYTNLVPEGFQLESHEVILYGACSECRKAERN